MKNKAKKEPGKKFDWLELKRQMFHALTGLVILVLLMFGILNKWIIGGILVFGYILFLINLRKRIPVLWWFIQHFERRENMKDSPGGGSFFYVLGVFLSLVLFPTDVAYVAIVVLALGDSISTFIGKNYGKTKAPWSSVKLLEGTIAGIILSFAGFLGLYYLFPVLSIPFSVTLLEGLAACAVAMVVEALEISIEKRKIDDNVVIPLVAGAVILVMRGLF